MSYPCDPISIRLLRYCIINRHTMMYREVFALYGVYYNEDIYQYNIC